MTQTWLGTGPKDPRMHCTFLDLMGWDLSRTVPLSRTDEGLKRCFRGVHESEPFFQPHSGSLQGLMAGSVDQRTQ